MLGTTAAYVGYLAISGTTLSGSWQQLAIGSALVLSGAALGKVLGLFYWNVVLRRTALRLRSLAEPSGDSTLSRTHSVPEQFSPIASVSAGKPH